MQPLVPNTEVFNLKFIYFLGVPFRSTLLCYCMVYNFLKFYIISTFFSCDTPTISTDWLFSCFFFTISILFIWLICIYQEEIRHDCKCSTQCGEDCHSVKGLRSTALQHCLQDNDMFEESPIWVALFCLVFFTFFLFLSYIYNPFLNWECWKEWGEEESLIVSVST